MTEFLVMMGVVFGGAVLFFIYVNFIKPAQLKGKSIEGKVETLLKKDLSSGYASYTFYQNHNYNKAYSQKEWKALYETTQKVAQQVDKDSEVYAALLAAFINAIVVDESGYYARRGMENRAHSLEKFMPGVNDRISLNYFVEPYKYVKDEQRAAESVQSEQKAAQERAQRAATSYAAAPPSAPQGPKPLTFLEKNELRSAQTHYDTCVREHAKAKTRNVSPSVVASCEAAEKRAFAELMRVQAKYAGRE